MLRPGCSYFAEKASPMVSFPLLLIPLAIYNIIVFLMPGVSLAEPIVKLTLISRAEWPVTLSDMLLALGIVLLLFEVIRAARPGAKYLTDHLLSLIIFGGAVAEFLLWPRFASSTYFLLALLSLVDFLSGIALRTRRGTVAATSRPRPDFVTPDPEPQFPDPHPASEAVNHPLPNATHSDIAPSPEVPSPGLQPGNGSSRSPDASR
jgi:hypothetical protein